MQAPRVLIADSDPHLRQLLFSALLAVDVFSDSVASVPEALEKLRDEPYGLVLVDVALPGGSAEQLLNAIRDLQTIVRPVVLVLAANPVAARTLDVDIVQIVLRKPVALRQTVELIRSCVQNAALRASVVEDVDGERDHVTS